MFGKIRSQLHCFEDIKDWIDKVRIAMFERIMP